MSKSSKNLQYVIQMECLKFDIKVPLERRAVIAFLLYNEHHVEHNWLKEKVNAAKMGNYERFYEKLPEDIKLVYKTHSLIDGGDISSFGQYKGWKGNVRKYGFAHFKSLVGLVNAAEDMSKFGSIWNNIHSQVVMETSRFPTDYTLYYINVSTGAAAEFIQHILGTYSDPDKDIPIINCAGQGLKRIFEFRDSTYAHIYGIYTRSTFENEYNLKWVPQNI